MFATLCRLESNRALSQGMTDALARVSAVVVAVDSRDQNLDVFKGTSPSVILVPESWGRLSACEALSLVAEILPSARRLVYDVEAAGSDLIDAVNTGLCHGILRLYQDADECLAILEHNLSRFEEQTQATQLSDMLRQRYNDLENLTKQYKAQAESRSALILKAKRELESTFDAITDPLILVDRNYRMQRANLATARRANRDVREMPGALCHLAMFGREAPCPGCPINDVSVDWSSSDHPVREIVDDRDSKAFQLTAFGLDAAGEGGRFIGYYRDVTSERRLARQVRQAEKMAAIGHLAGGVAHEINNPIGVILSFAQTSKTSARIHKDDDLYDNLDEIEKAAKRCRDIVKGLLGFARPALEDRPVAVDLSESMDGAWFLVATQKSTRGVELERRFAQDVCARGNSNQLLQVFINLIQNAVQAMEGKGRLLLETWFGADGWVGAAVEDTGPGIPEEHLKHIFEPFFTTKAPGEGTGLGLSVSYGIVESLGGRIEVRSVPGQGARFEVHLPALKG